MKSKLLLTTLLVGSALTLAACGNNKSAGSSSTEAVKITAVGSTALQPLVEANVEGYTQEHSGAQISVQGGGSGTGLSQVQTGSVQIGDSDVFAEEKDGVDAKAITDHKVAVVGIAPIVNKEVGVTDISKADLIKIFKGEITNWKEVGGKDQAINLINRAEGSGTRFNFEKYGLDNAQVKKSQEQDSSGAAVSMVASTPGAISYAAFSNINDTIAALSIDGVEPTEANVSTNKWTIWAYEHMYTFNKDKQVKASEDFITYVEKNDKLIKQLGYQPISDMKVERSADGKVSDK